MYSSLQESKSGDWQLKHLLDKQCTSKLVVINTRSRQVLCREPNIPLTGTQSELEDFLEKWNGRVVFSLSVIKIRDLNGYYYLRSESKYKDSEPSPVMVA